VYDKSLSAGGAPDGESLAVVSWGLDVEARDWDWSMMIVVIGECRGKSTVMGGRYIRYTAPGSTAPQVLEACFSLDICSTFVNLGCHLSIVSLMNL
jgi:hypothetical protein